MISYRNTYSVKCPRWVIRWHKQHNSHIHIHAYKRIQFIIFIHFLTYTTLDIHSWYFLKIHNNNNKENKNNIPVTMHCAVFALSNIKEPKKMYQFHVLFVDFKYQNLWRRNELFFVRIFWYCIDWSQSISSITLA